jgi:hypothetical protein
VDCNGYEEGDGDSNKSGAQAMATATKRATATATEVVGGKMDQGNSGKIVGVSNNGGWRATATKAISMRVAGK